MTKQPKQSMESVWLWKRNIMEKSEITSLVILNKHKKAVGVVHLHDLLGKRV